MPTHMHVRAYLTYGGVDGGCTSLDVTYRTPLFCGMQRSLKNRQAMVWSCISRDVFSSFQCCACFAWLMFFSDRPVEAL